ncbi:Nramp family divalent metal transporter [Paludibaculum fermentans]|uniref:Nramp family divalent metal transporter n=1 Tax=Paludibaculum fermentans TaxID=1473598 RepID=UPI003EB722D3
MKPESRLARWSASIGPGIVFALTASGPGSFVSNAAAGATYGYALVWALGFTLLFRYAWLDTSARYVLVTGETLLDGYRRLSRPLVHVVLAGTIVVRHLSNMYKVVLLGSCIHLLLPLPFPWSARFWSVLSIALAYTMIRWGGYSVVERCCKALVAIMTASLIVAAFLSHADPAALWKALILPGLPADKGAYSAALLVMALIGTEAGSLTNLTYSYFLRAKGWTSARDLPRQRFDLFTSITCIFLLGTLVQIAAAASIHPLGLKLKNADDLVRIFSQSLGVAGRLIFGAGMWASAFSGFIGGTTGYALMVTDILRHGMLRSGAAGLDSKRPAPETRRDPYFQGFVAFWCFSPLYVLFTNWEPVVIILIVNSLMVVLIPVLALALLRLTNDRKRLGDHTNRWSSNVVLSVMIVVSIWLMLRNLINWW